MLSRRFRWWRVKGEKLDLQSRVVVRLFKVDGEGEEETLARYDLPAVIEKDADGEFPLISGEVEHFGEPMSIDGIEISMRHTPSSTSIVKRLVQSIPQEPR